MSSKKQSSILELKNDLKETERSCQELKREVSSLKNKLNLVESEIKIKEQEITELIALRNQDEDKENELRNETVSLKQKVRINSICLIIFIQYFKIL